MKEPDIISRLPPAADSMRFDALLNQGIQACQQLGGDVWTDYNEHDPGVTILEQLCFAITELGMRANYPIGELLAPSLARARVAQARAATSQANASADVQASAPANIQLDTQVDAQLNKLGLDPTVASEPPPETIDCEAHTLITGDRILSSAPVTVGDYRKLLYDRVHNLKNAWLERVAVDKNPYRVNGLLNVEVESFGEETAQINAAGQQTALKNLRQQVSDWMHQNRNLGEDIASIVILTPKEFTVQATVTLAHDADPVHTLALILFRIQFNLVPFPEVSALPAFSPEQSGNQPDQLYVGPLLKLGVIDDLSLIDKLKMGLIDNATLIQKMESGVVDYESMSAKCDKVTTDSLYRIILGVEGVKAVRDVRINNASDDLKIEKSEVPRLKPSFFSNTTNVDDIAIQLERNNTPVAVDKNQVMQRCAQLFARLKRQEVFMQEQVDNAAYVRLPAPDGQDVGNYYSVQHHFPATYGIGRFAGLTGASNDLKAKQQRSAQKHQLQAYLLFFEQLLANSAAQLADAWRLFELERELDSSYFWQPVVNRADDGTEPPDMLAVLADSPPPQPPAPELLGHVVYVNASDHHAEILLRSREFDSFEQARLMRRRILKAAGNAHRYRLQPLPTGEFGLILEDSQGQSLAFASVRFDSEHEAKKEIERIVTFLRHIHHHHDRRQIEQRIVVETRGVYGVKLLDDDGRVIFSAYHLTAQQQQWSVAALLEHGESSACYRIRVLKSGDCMLVLHAGDGRVILQGELRFSSERHARVAIESAIELLQRLRFRPDLQSAHLQQFPPLPVEIANGDKLDSHARRLETLVRGFDDFLERRNRFLNHLLARFGESFDDGSLEQFDPAPVADRQAFLQDLVSWKINFLQQCVYLGERRNCGVDIGTVNQNQAVGRSVLEQRLTCLLGMPSDGAASKHGDRWNLYAGEELHLQEHILLLPQPNGAPYREAAKHASDTDDFYSNRVSVLLPNWPIRMKNQEFCNFVQYTLEQNCPAHLFAQCFWLSLERMTEFKTVRDGWMRLRCAYTAAAAGCGPGDALPDSKLLNAAAQKLQAFLRTCEQDESASALGGKAA